jgi:hypothetical protein
MCTVSYTPGTERTLLVSNRDERMSRKPAMAPAWYLVNNRRLLFPKDGEAGGSWIGMNETNCAAVLLNGAWTAHQHHPPYAASRGTVLLTALSDQDPFYCIRHYPLAGIEPFTLILLQDQRLEEYRWDGKNLSEKHLPSNEPHIWASVTLYDETVIAKRKKWFQHFLQQTNNPGLDAVMDFHRFAGDGDAANDLCMNRENELCTVSITAIDISFDSGSMIYLDMLNNQRHTIQWPVPLQRT